MNVELDYMAEPQGEMFAIDTTNHGRVTGKLYGMTDSVAGQTLPRTKTIAHKGIILDVRGKLTCIPVGRSVYEKFLQEVERRHIRIWRRGEHA